ncbi:ABC transporter substrate-binding protein, partial [Streptomyces platensis]
MMTNAKIGVALVGGYLLGRTKKAKMALGLGLFLAGKKLNLDPKQLGTLVANSPVLGPLNDQVRKELVDATKTAAGTALTQRMSGLADSLHERTAALNQGRGGGGARERAGGGARSAAGAPEPGPP